MDCCEEGDALLGVAAFKGWGVVFVSGVDAIIVILAKAKGCQKNIDDVLAIQVDSRRSFSVAVVVRFCGSCVDSTARITVIRL